MVAHTGGGSTWSQSAQLGFETAAINGAAVSQRVKRRRDTRKFSKPPLRSPIGQLYCNRLVRQRPQPSEEKLAGSMEEVADLRSTAPAAKRKRIAECSPHYKSCVTREEDSHSCWLQR